MKLLLGYYDTMTAPARQPQNLPPAIGTLPDGIYLRLPKGAEKLGAITQ
jgi:hypothetical protein